VLAVLTVIALFVAIFDGALTIVIAVRQRRDEAVDQRHWENQARFDEVLAKLEQIQTAELAELLKMIKEPPRLVELDR
jgi:uncharacterized membrane-anchored protein YhcB (DUF1043 family)